MVLVSVLIRAVSELQSSSVVEISSLGVVGVVIRAEQERKRKEKGKKERERGVVRSPRRGCCMV